MAHPRRRHKSNHHSFNIKKEPTDNHPGNDLGGPQGRSSEKGNDNNYERKSLGGKTPLAVWQEYTTIPPL